ncbi:unnamed protein product [Rotaria sordida]|uniref:Uncharacterized protein n=1 Tax=Rotaria sordida TaxID=392033 RepID=A0A814ZUM0_9BILA|nr:unnamed protein product [Rotaria sordida]CAF1530008.1 unnamed protein product [Rotaria sordida]
MIMLRDIEHGFLQCPSHVSLGHTDLMTISYLISGNTSRIARPSIKFRFSPTITSSCIDQQGLLTQNNPKTNELLNVEQLQLKHLSNVTIHT